MSARVSALLCVCACLPVCASASLRVRQCAPVCAGQVLHLDLKPSNFVCVSGMLKIIDFGIARPLGLQTNVISQSAVSARGVRGACGVRNAAGDSSGRSTTCRRKAWLLPWAAQLPRGWARRQVL